MVRLVSVRVVHFWGMCKSFMVEEFSCLDGLLRLSRLSESDANVASNLNVRYLLNIYAETSWF